ncbi:hypothetical protein CUMW_255200 [Citrus unshiu]|uniref:Uncharacterized protein n=1 Tax=Citrus unshiu TaxID=55188 RepID=A0A2H5QSK8_CITUN|nr:hypothetical protein CUMW_255200 [Citrus unshiu]
MGIALRGFGCKLANEFILPNANNLSSLKKPPLEYKGIRKEDWKSFVDKILSEDFQSELRSQVEQGTFQSQGPNDILGEALQKKPNGSRVQGLGQFITPSMYFNVPNPTELA